MREFYQRDCNQAAALALCRPWLLFFLLEGTPARRSFAPDVPREQASSAALDERKSRTGRRSRNTFHTVRHDLRTERYRNQNIPCWPLRRSEERRVGKE